MSMLVPAEGLNRLTQISTQAAAMRPVKMKVPMVEPRILPRRFMLAMLPTADAMDTNTRGTTMVNSRFRKMSPMGLMVVPTAGAKAPISAPMIMPPRIRIRLPYCCQKLFFSIVAISFLLFSRLLSVLTRWDGTAGEAGHRLLTAASSCAMAFSSVARGQAALSRM